jgi:hypothetical protein
MDFKCTWKTVLAILSAILGVFAGVLAFDDRYVTAKELARLEQQTVKSMEQFQKNQEVFQTNLKKEALEQRYIQLTDQEMQWELLTIKNPTNPDIKRNYNKVVKEREKVRQELEKNK